MKGVSGLMRDGGMRNGAAGIGRGLVAYSSMTALV
jgi:hypothetical protein